LRRQHGQRLGPGQRGALARREQRGVAPDGDVMQAQLALAMDPGLLDVHVQAEAALVDLRGPDRHQVLEFADDGLGLQGGAERQIGLGKLGGNCKIVQALSGHGWAFEAGSRGARPGLARNPYAAASMPRPEVPRMVIRPGPWRTPGWRGQPRHASPSSGAWNR